ncbi:MAG: SDR family oxidoreductase [Actinobacteria bacterium]|nr:SDR family oxidoreductase [Actinomycetota bacterium]
MSNDQQIEGLSLEGKTAVVTGAAGGIGSVIAQDLARLGAQVVVCDIRVTSAYEVASNLPNASAVEIDLGDPGSVASAIGVIKENVGSVDVLVNNAGWDQVGPFLESDPAVWEKLVAINLKGPIQLTHGLLPDMVEAGWGRLIFISSDAARVGSSGEAVYSACKGGIMAFAKTLARETARSGITSNTVCPGPSDTPLLREISEGNPKLVESLKRAIPIGRLGEPKDISGLVSYLCSPRAAYITGQTISVSGGLTMA